MAKDEKSICSEVQGVPIELASNPGLSVPRVGRRRRAFCSQTPVCPSWASPVLVARPSMEGQEALEYLRSERFDAVISDLQMPGMSGMDLLTQVRRSYPHVAFW